MTLRADLDQMRVVAATLQSYGADLTAERITLPLIGADTGALRSIVAAQRLTTVAMNGTLVPGCSERLSETGEIMVNCADMFQNVDEGRLPEVITVFNNATGTWRAGS